MLNKSSKWELSIVHYKTKFTISRFVISRFDCSRNWRAGEARYAWGEKSYGVEMAVTDTRALMASFKLLPINGGDQKIGWLLIFFPPAIVWASLSVPRRGNDYISIAVLLCRYLPIWLMRPEIALVKILNHEKYQQP